LIEEILPDSTVLPKPINYSGLVLVSSDREDASKIIEKNIPEAEKVFPVKCYTSAELESLAKSANEIALDIDGPFAVKTTRRGKHEFSSIDVNIKVGEVIKNKTGQSVNLDFPEKVVFVEIIDKHAYMGVVDGNLFPKKKSREKIEIRNFFQKVSIVQMPYLGKSPAPKEMGTRIGREAQTFEVGELIISPVGACRADELREFLEGVHQGIESRYQIQKRVYSHRPRRVEVYVQNLYELVRERRDENIIVFEPEGRPVSKISGEMARMVIKGKRTNFLIGSREGIPTGIYRFADLVVDLCPGVTIATDSAISSAMIALSFSLQENLDGLTEVP
jgi:tRNA acetyltransferase TAN1